MSVEPIQFQSGSLTLEGELSVPETVLAGSVIAHPHPQHGGNMRSIAPGLLFNDLPLAGVACLRFNFRGIGNSEGEFGGGEGEKHDLQAALEVLADIVEGLPLVVAGWSFGADTALCLDDPRISGWFAVAPPLRNFTLADWKAAHDARPKRLCVPQNDQFCPPAQAAKLTADWKNTEIVEIKGADHFLIGRTHVVSESAVGFVESFTKEIQ